MTLDQTTKENLDTFIRNQIYDTKIVLIVDQPKRDLFGVVNIAYHLALQGVTPIIVGTKNELISVMKYKPAMIVFPHVRYERQTIILKYAKGHLSILHVFMLRLKYIFCPWRLSFFRNSRDEKYIDSDKIWELVEKFNKQESKNVQPCDYIVFAPKNKFELLRLIWSGMDG